MMLNEVPRCAADDPAGAWIDMLYSYTATMERGSFLKCETIDIPSTLTKSQSQVLQFLNGGSIFDYPSYESSPPVSLYPPKLISPCAQIQPPVMHPNLVCTLKSILSPRTEFDCSQSSTSGDSRCTESGISQISNVAEVQGSEQRADYSGTKASSPESTSWPRSSDFKQQEAVVVPVDLIHNRRPYQCAFTRCQRTFKNPQTMRMHHKTHFTDASAAAAKLGGAPEALVVLTSSAAMKAGHNKKIPSRCPKCYKTFVGLYELRRHFGRKHSEGEKRFACRKCGKRFHVEVDVRDHEKLCGEPIVCTCGMKFAFKCNLVAHKRSHPRCQADQPAVEEKRKFPILSPRLY